MGLSLSPESQMYGKSKISPPLIRAPYWSGCLWPEASPAMLYFGNWRTAGSEERMMSRLIHCEGALPCRFWSGKM
jgi:hypothetical protein